jgi:hypothetical protein
MPGIDHQRKGRREAMSKVLLGVFTVVFIGALVYEFLNRTKPDLMEKFETKVSGGLDSILTPAEEKA